MGVRMVSFVLLGAVALIMTLALAARALRNTPIEPAPEPGELVGSLGTVVTRIPDDGFGEVTVTTDGHRLKLQAVAEAPIGTGATVVVVDTDSPTSVVVAESGF